MNTQQQMNHSENAERIANAMERVLRPFIRLFVGHVSCGFMIQRIKRIYIEEARKWIEKNDVDGRVTKSKLAMLTGLDTRTITSIESTPNLQNIEADLCAETSVLNGWTTKKEYLDYEGKPKKLPVVGRGASFQSLVTSVVGRNVTYHTVLDRLVESKNIIHTEDDFVELSSPFFTPLKSDEQSIIDSGTTSIGRLVRTIHNNLVAENIENKMIQQDRWTNTIPCEKIPEVKRIVRQKINEQIVEIEKIIEDYEFNGSNDSVSTCKLGVGWFLFD